MLNVHRTPIAVLRNHHVGTEQVAALERAFGKLFPEDVDSPDAATQWAFGLLPWQSVAPILEVWLRRAAERSGLSNEPCVSELRAMLVGDIDVARAEEIAEDAEDHFRVEAQACGVPLVYVPADPIVRRGQCSPAMRGWAVVQLVAIALVTAATGKSAEDARDGAKAALAIIHWVAWSEKNDRTRHALLDGGLRQAMESLASQTRGWVRAAAA